jgi:hypothetical protein
MWLYHSAEWKALGTQNNLNIDLSEDEDLDGH